MGVTGQHHAPSLFIPGKESRCQLIRRMGGPQSSCGRFGIFRVGENNNNNNNKVLGSCDRAS